MEIKKLDFIVHPKVAAEFLGIDKYDGKRAMLNLPVDLDALSPRARSLAQATKTLVHGQGDDSYLPVTSTKTKATLFADKIRSDWDKLPYERDFDHGHHETPDEYINEYYRRYDTPSMHKPLVIDWKFDSLRYGESTEAYFERHANKIDAIGGSAVTV